MSKEPNRNVYVGHRYVPKIMGEWDKTQDYEGLSIVLYQGTSYTSKKRVPVGIDILNEEFWAVTGNYNAQVDYYRDETERVAQDLLLKSDKTYVDTELGKKADTSFVNTELDKKADTSFVNTELDKKADTSFVNTELDKKADTYFVNTELDKKSDNTEVDEIKRDINYRAINVSELGIADDSEMDQTDQLEQILKGEHYNIIIPFGIKVTRDIVIRNKDKFTITFTNQSTIITDDCNGLKFVGCQDLKIDEYSSRNIDLNWENIISGLIIEDSSNPKIKINVIRDYKRGYTLKGIDGGVAYGTITANKLYCNETDVYVYSSGNGWVTEMDFYSGRYYLESVLKTNTSDTWAVQVINDGRYESNNLRFYSPSFETKHNGIKANGTEWLISHPRFEGIDDNYISGTLRRSIFIFGYGLFATEKINLDSQSRHNSVIGKGWDFESSFSTIGGQFSGYAFINAGNGDLDKLGELTYIPGRKSIGLKNARDINQPFNKQYESSDIPTEGTYHNGAIVWKYPPTPGETMGWACRYPGTAGELNDVFITVNAGERNVTFNNNENIKTGDHIKFGEESHIVVEVHKNNKARLQTIPSGSYTNASVSYVPPVFIPMPEYPL